MSVIELSPTPGEGSLPITTDVVLFTVSEQRLRVLLVNGDGGARRLPGGFARTDEDLDLAALRHLRAEAGLSGVYLEQLYTFGRPDRHPARRVISVAYYALVPAATVAIALDDHRRGPLPEWCRLDTLPPLSLDHGEIVRVAHERLAAKLEYSTIALQLMPGHFTLSELQRVYEAIVGEPLDKRNFRKRMLSLGCLEETGGQARVGRHRPAKLYRLRAPGRVLFTK
jgi:8-oxo-dGTP diphosphatase